MRRLRKMLGEGSELHRQIYYGWRFYPHGMAHTGLFGFMVGASLAVLVLVLMGRA